MRVPARVAYVGVILLATLSGLSLDLDAGALRERLERMLQITVSRVHVIDAARNVILFAGWGLLWMVTAPPARSWRALGHAVLSGIALSLFVECLQLLSDTRIGSINDLLTNSGGALLGALVLVAVVRGLAGLAGARSFVGVPASVFAVAYGGAAASEAFMPLLRQDVRVTTSGGPVQRLAATLGEFRWSTLLEPPLEDLLLFVPAGIFAVTALVEAGRSYGSAARSVTLFGTLSLIAAEIAHGAIGVEVHAGAAALHAVAVSGGAWLAAIALPTATGRVRGVRRPRLLTGAYALTLLLWALRPYRPEVGFEAVLAKLSVEWWIPLRLLGMSVSMFSVIGVLTSFLLYLPLGALLAVWPLRQHGPMAAYLPAVYLAAVTEIGQIFVATRTLDVTNLMIQAAGAVVGWVIVRRAGFRPYGSQLPPRRGGHVD